MYFPITLYIFKFINWNKKETQATYWPLKYINSSKIYVKIILMPQNLIYYLSCVNLKILALLLGITRRGLIQKEEV